MIPPDENLDRNPGQPGATPPHKGFTLVEAVVTIGVACILMVAVVGFLVNGFVSTAKTTAINDQTVRGRYVFEHLSHEMARANDLDSTDFTGANPNWVAPSTPTPGKSLTGIPVVQLQDQCRRPGHDVQRHAGDERRLESHPAFDRSPSRTGLPDAAGGRLCKIPQPLDAAFRRRGDFERLGPLGRRDVEHHPFAGSLPACRSGEQLSVDSGLHGPDHPAPEVLRGHDGPEFRRHPALVVPGHFGDADLPGCREEPSSDRRHEPVPLLRHPEDRGCGSHDGLRGRQPSAHGAELAERQCRVRAVEVLLEQHGERRVRQQVDEVVYAALPADAHAVAVAHPIALADPDSVAHPDTDTVPHPDSVTHGNPDAVAHAVAHAHPDSLAVAHTHTVADPHAVAHTHGNPDAVADAHTVAYSDTFADAHTVAHTDAYADTDAFADADAVADAHALAHAFADPHTVAHTDTVADAHPVAHADTYADADTFAHTFAVAYTDAFAYAHAFADAVAHPDAVAHALTDADTVADAHTDPVAHAFAFTHAVAHTHAFAHTYADAVAHAHAFAAAG